LTQRLLTNAKLHPAFADVKRPGSVSLPRGHDKEQPEKPAAKPSEPKAPPKAPPKAAGGVKPAYPDCDPKPVGVDKVRSFPGTDSRTWGFTNPILDTGTYDIVFEYPFCKFKGKSLPSLTFDPFVYAAATKKGETYLDGTKVSPDRPCLGKTFEKRVHITPEMADSIRDAEIEHCNDNHRAFDLTYGRYISLIKALGSAFPGTDVDHCREIVSDIFKDSAGITPGQLLDKMFCLSAKSPQIRDGGTTPWHGILLGEPKYAKDCKSAEYTPDYKTASPEVGKHKSEEIIKGCDVKE
jgi:hypothetical protein